MNFKNTLQILGIILIAGCTPALIIKDDPSIKEIAICTQMSSSVPNSLKNDIDSVTNKFIEDYNQERNNYKLIQCQNDGLRSLYLDVLRISITNPGTQAAGVAITTIGAITPIVLIATGAPFYIWFAYLPRSSIQMNLKLSKDISARKESVVRNTSAGSGQYFGSYETQKKLLLNGYYAKLKQEMYEIEINRRK